MIFIAFFSFICRIISIFILLNEKCSAFMKKTFRIFIPVIVIIFFVILHTAINSRNNFFQEIENRDYQIILKYEDSTKKNEIFTETIDINLNYLEEENDLRLKTLTDLVNIIDKLTKEIKKT